jgi:hypothetical protein
MHQSANKISTASDQQAGNSIHDMSWQREARPFEIRPRTSLATNALVAASLSLILDVLGNY